MIKAVIFDIGGVVQGIDWSFVVNSLLDLKEDLDIETYKNAFYNDRKNYLDLYMISKISGKDFWRMVASKLDLNEKHSNRLSESFEHLYSFTNNEILDLIKTIKPNYKIFALANACPEIEKKVIRDNTYTYLFDKIYFSHNIGAKKPEREAYLKITEENDLKPEECILIDNDIKNIKGAKDIGMGAILISNNDLLKKDLFELLKNGGNNKKIIGYTTGVFDLFHEGHLNLLRNAKDHCDILIVGVTTDELSFAFKGKYPVMSFNERSKIVSSVKYVDNVVLQENMDKFEAWEKYDFDIMFTSENPTDKWPEVEEQFLGEFIGSERTPPRIVQLPYTIGVSSTSRRDVIQKN